MLLLSLEKWLANLENGVQTLLNTCFCVFVPRSMLNRTLLNYRCPFKLVTKLGTLLIIFYQCDGISPGQNGAIVACTYAYESMSQIKLTPCASYDAVNN